MITNTIVSLCLYCRIGKPDACAQTQRWSNRHLAALALPTGIPPVTHALSSEQLFCPHDTQTLGLNLSKRLRWLSLGVCVSIF